MKNLAEIKLEYLAYIKKSNDLEDLEKIKIAILGRTGIITNLLKSLNSVEKEQRPVLGKQLNDLKNHLLNNLEAKRTDLEYLLREKTLKESVIDVTINDTKSLIGKIHPLSLVLDDIKLIFARLGYDIADGPEIDNDYYNFEALNFPKDHPARDMHDTFFIDNNFLLRTHTSNVQIHLMQKKQAPIKVLIPGRVYRCDETDASHSPIFHQLEGLVIDQEISFADLKGTLIYFLQSFFGKDKEVRFRPSFFPFTEPSAEVDVQCILCSGNGCKLCKNTGWLEILGAGMVDPNVLKAVNYDSKKISGLAFGMGIERIAMLKYGIDDIRHFLDNDLRFLKQF